MVRTTWLIPCFVGSDLFQPNSAKLTRCSAAPSLTVIHSSSLTNGIKAKRKNLHRQQSPICSPEREQRAAQPDHVRTVSHSGEYPSVSFFNNFLTNAIPTHAWVTLRDDELRWWK
ncbi:hypothetical protein Q8A73_003995 [Channa argus]|nr:hypothetical protein Q8A73_003995 [Channa argus]